MLEFVKAPPSFEFSMGKRSPRNAAFRDPEKDAWPDLFGCACAPSETEIRVAGQDLNCRPHCEVFNGVFDDDFQDDDFVDSIGLSPTPRVGGLQNTGTNLVGVGEAAPEELEAVMTHLLSICEQKGLDIRHIEDSNYSMNGRSVRLFLLPWGTPAPNCTHLNSTLDWRTLHAAEGVIVHDGPLKQPFFDYLFQTGLNEDYDSCTENLSVITGRARNHTFFVAPYDDRLDAMELATSQSEIRKRVSQQFENQPAVMRGALAPIRPGPSRYSKKGLGARPVISRN